MQTATEGQIIAIKDIAKKLVSSGSVSFGLLDNIDTLTAEEAGLIITEYKYRNKKRFGNFSLGNRPARSLTQEQRDKIIALVIENGLTSKEQSALYKKAGARFLETLTIAQASLCISYLTEISQNREIAGHA
jgi:hypothetical protein